MLHSSDSEVQTHVILPTWNSTKMLAIFYPEPVPNSTIVACTELEEVLIEANIV